MLCDAGRSGRAKGRRVGANDHVKKTVTELLLFFLCRPLCVVTRSSAHSFSYNELLMITHLTRDTFRVASGIIDGASSEYVIKIGLYRICIFSQPRACPGPKSSVCSLTFVYITACKHGEQPSAFQHSKNGQTSKKRRFLRVHFNLK